MSLRNKKRIKELSAEDINSLRSINQQIENLACQGLSPEYIKRTMDAQAKVFTIKDTDRQSKGSVVDDGFTKISDIDPSNGIIIRNPVTNKNEVMLGTDNNILNLDGSLHPATVRYLNKYT